MKFTCTVEVNAPRDTVITLWENPDNLNEWQDGFESMKRISGEPGGIGSKSLMIYKNGKRDMELEETVLVNNLPEEFTGEYVHIHMTNTMQNVFEALGENTTRWTVNIEYTVFNGFMVKLMVKLFPSMFRKQTQKWLNQFKAFAERSVQAEA